MRVSLTTIPKTLRYKNHCTGAEETVNSPEPPERSITLAATSKDDHEFIDALSRALINSSYDNEPCILSVESKGIVTSIHIKG